MSELHSADKESAPTPHTVLRGVYLQDLLNLGMDTLYLVIEYPSDDVFEMWKKVLECELDDQSLHDGVPYGKFLIRKGLLGYKLSIWEGDARLLLTHRVTDNSPTGRGGMGVMLQLGPKWLAQYGDVVSPETLKQNIYDQLKSFGLKDAQNYPARINRLDIALDFKGIKVNDFSLDEWRQNWVGYGKIRSAFFSPRLGVMEGMTFGSGGSVVRLKVYDKVLQAKGDKDYDFWKSAWGLEDEEDFEVTRFEWQFRPYHAKFTDMYYLEDFTYEGYLGLLNYAVEKWGRLCSPIEGDDNRSRWPLSPLWEELIAHIKYWNVNYDGLATREYHTTEDFTYDYAKNFAGHLGGLLGKVGLELKKPGPVTVDEALDYLQAEHDYGPENFHIKGMNKYDKLARKAGVDYKPEEVPFD